MFQFRLLLVALMLPLLLPNQAAAQALDPTFTAPTNLYAPGGVYALGPQQADGKRLVSGDFTRVNGTTASRLVRLDAAGALDVAFTQNLGTFNGTAFKVRNLAGGQYLLGFSGGSAIIGGVSRTELMRLNNNGTVDAAFDAGTGPGYGGTTAGGVGYDYTVQPDGKILVTGSFDSFNGTAANGVVRLNANGSVDPSFATGTGTGTDYGNTALVLPSGKILVGGNFATFDGTTANALVRLNANGSVDATFTAALEPGGEVESLTLQPDGNVLVSGSLTTLSVTNPNSSLVRVLPSGALDPSFATPAFTDYGSITANYFDKPVQLQPDGKILVIGYFNTPGANHVARLNANGSLDTSFSVVGGPSSVPYTLGLQASGAVLVGGTFYTFNGTEATLAQLSSTGTPVPAFAPVLQTTGNVAALARQPDGKLVLGGNFTELNGQPVHRLVRLTATGTLDAGFTAAAGVVAAPVTALVLQPDGKALAGTAAGVFRYGTGGSPDPSFVAFRQFTTTALALQADGRVLAGTSTATTSTTNGPSRYLVRMTSTGAFDNTFSRPLTGSGPGVPEYSTNAILVQPDGRIVVAGLFTPTGQPSVARVVRYETTGALDATFDNMSAFTANAGSVGLAARVYALALQPDGKLLVGGSFGAVNGTPRARLARLTAAGALDASFVPGTSTTGTVYAITRQPNGRVLVGGSFTNTGTATLTNLLRVLDTGQTDVSFGPTATPNSTVRALLVQPDGGIVLAGRFTTIGGVPAAGVARLTAPNVLHVAAPAAVAARTAAWPVPAHTQLHIAPDASAGPLTVELLDALGRTVQTAPLTNAADVTLDTAHLPAGVYVLRVQYEAGTVVRRISVE